MVEQIERGLDTTYGALASPVRRSILVRLASGEARITDVAEPFSISLAAVSKHIQVLEEAGLVRRRVEGRTHWLALDGGALEDAAVWIERTRAYWTARLDALESLFRQPPVEGV